VVIVELAQRVPDRSPPVRFTSAASALAMFKTLSTMAFACSRVYIGGRNYGWVPRASRRMRAAAAFR
jgi:hypothetical protein